LKALGFLPAPRLEDRGTGGVESICTSIRSSETSKPTLFFISPKGSIKLTPWRSGYKHIRQNLGYEMHAAIVDYSRRTLCFERIDTMDHIEKDLKSKLAQGCPLNPDNAEMAIECFYDRFELLSCVDLVSLSNIFLLMPIMKALYVNEVMYALLAFSSFLASWAYHADHEHSGLELDAFLAKIVIVTTIAHFGMNMEGLLWFLASMLCYWLGTPRIAGQNRGPYIVWHSLFHIGIALTGLALIH